MESNFTSIHFELNDRARLVKTVLVIFGIITMGSIAFTPAQRSSVFDHLDPW